MHDPLLKEVQTYITTAIFFIGFQLLEAAKKNCRCQTILERGNDILTYDEKCA